MIYKRKWGMMMKIMKKTWTLLLSLVMVLAMSVTTFAADSTLKIKTTAGHTYKVYQILTGDVTTGDNGTKKLSNLGKGSSVTSNATAQEILNALKDKKDNELGDAAYEYVKGGKEVATISGDGSEKTVTIPTGYYIVTDEVTGETKDTVSRYMVDVVGPTEMTPKTSTTPDIDKKIIDTDANQALDDSKKTDTAAIGDTINYEVTGKVPDYKGYKYYYYVLNDTLSKGLTLDKDSFVVTVGGKPLTKDTDYYVYTTTNQDGTTSFKLAFENIKNFEVGADISVKYNATVNENAVIGKDPNTNTVKLEYSNNPNSSERGDKEPGIPGDKVPTGETPDRVTKTYVTELKLLKVDEQGNKLTGAEFTLTGENLQTIKFTTGQAFVENENGTYWKLKDGTYTTDDPNTEGMDQSKYENTTKKYKKETVITSQTADAGSKKVTAFVDENGQIQFTGLNAGKYTLTETVVPKGYNKIDPIEFTISATQDGSTTLVGGNITWSSDNHDITYSDGVFGIKVTNKSGSTLPSTGGIGTTIFYIIGGVLMLGAAVLLITKKRMSAR
ncbi:isopeptide-forming domain-containing fimbrial protein [Anaerostipes sp. MSJ-23]|uniref:isopeptide-forming domain-containing fimbrial protein n=1 Tax=Anaerostipes sp. MSJ-23 TaxID=2841520 RepID=UPI001C0F62D7|nr:isopeptide-forming domain-containing fimbrial protein [Anaerostipes sp. MSJ-23]MBU5459317.1 isopeptide-forming domain-containing fimbrial protein [Anaerostipes sp. MSJ-23]